MNFTILGEMDPKTQPQSTAPSSTNNDKRLNNENQEPKRQQQQSSPVKPQPPAQSSSSSSSSTVSTNKFFKQESLKQPSHKAKSPLLSNKNNNSTLNSTASCDKNSSFNGFKIFTIASLNPYQNKYKIKKTQHPYSLSTNFFFCLRWSIKARVTNKSAIRTWSNSKGEGKLFSVELIDQSGDIKANVFTDACDRFYDVFQLDHVNQF
jgi:hypothetical protein